jgi:thymidylate synthase (FAD)
MTRLSDVSGDTRYKQYLDQGFVALIDHMGSDQTIEFATRMSYGKGTRMVSDTKNLLRYLVRNYHTSPIEMGEVQFHLKVPIFVMRQLVRHRTANLNEYSARYSELTDEFYVPPSNRLAKQSTTNKQGSGEAFNKDVGSKIESVIEDAHSFALNSYRKLLDKGLTRELARGVMPVNGYTELVWKCDLKNFFNLLKLRLDPHAQQEIVELAELMYIAVQPHFPILTEAFEDYWLNGESLSRFEITALMQLLFSKSREDLIAAITSASKHRPDCLSKREITEFVDKFK